MTPIREVFATLHDGEIVSVEGSVPGDMRWIIDIPFLTKRLTGDRRDMLQLDINAVSLFDWVQHDNESPPADLRDMSAEGVRIYEVAPERDNTLTEVILWEGDARIRLAARDVSLSLLSGRSIPFREWKQTAESYWSELNSRNS